MQARYIHHIAIHDTQPVAALVNHLYDLIKPAAVLDVGCGPGNFLRVFKDLGVSQVKGLDGEWVQEEALLISREEFLALDLEQAFDLQEQFDLVLCLEVAEHLDSCSAFSLVQSLTAHGEIIVFSAAIPGQGGQNHLNEQPHHYWCALFEQLGYPFYDIIRPAIWENENIPAWYRQNMFLAVKQGHALPGQKGWKPVHSTELHTTVHPQILLNCRSEQAAWQQKATLAENNYNSFVGRKISLEYLSKNSNCQII